MLGGGWDEHITVYREGSGGVEEERIETPGELPLLAELRAFVEHLGGGTPPRSSAAEGAATVAAIAGLRRLPGIELDDGCDPFGGRARTQVVQPDRGASRHDGEVVGRQWAWTPRSTFVSERTTFHWTGSTERPQESRNSSVKTPRWSRGAREIAARRLPEARRDYAVAARTRSNLERSGRRRIRRFRPALHSLGPADVAQLVEHFTRNEGVPGSSPGVGSLFKPFLAYRSEDGRAIGNFLATPDLPRRAASAIRFNGCREQRGLREPRVSTT